LGEAVSRRIDDRIFKNTFKDIENILTTCARNDTRFEIECYDIGHLYTLRHFADRGLVKAPFFIQSVFGILGGIGGHPEDVLHMRRTAIASSARTTSGASSAPAGTSCRLRRCQPRWAATSGSASRIRCGSGPASSRAATPNRFVRRGRSLKN
jgi:hypothetical protein